jgi:ribosome maturation factor RimP
MDPFENTVKDELAKITEPLHLRLIEVSAKRARNGLNIIVVVDKDGGVTIADCELVTKLLNDRFSVLQTFDQENYNLQVSSPGMFRVFKRMEEYDLFQSRNVKVILKEPLSSGQTSTVLEGKLEGIDDAIVTILVDDERLNIPLEKISKTKLNG